jgi:hypothetical protein
MPSADSVASRGYHVTGVSLAAPVRTGGRRMDQNVPMSYPQTVPA